MYVDALLEAKRQQRLRDYLILALVLLAGGAMLGWKTTQQQITVDVRPGLIQRVTTAPGAMPPENVFNFALTLLQQLYRWRENGRDEYPANIATMRTYLTESCRSKLEADAKERTALGELGDRTRRWEPMVGTYFAPERVQALDDGRVWKVVLDAQIAETVAGETVKDGFYRYEVFVESTGTDRDVNPFGLVLNCFAPGSPTALETSR